ncbi:uncharacterized protein LOC144818155 [Lissotriton helveticus]
MNMPLELPSASALNKIKQKSDEKLNISEAVVAAQDSDLVGIAKWAHQKCRHFGENISCRHGSTHLGFIMQRLQVP